VEWLESQIDELSKGLRMPDDFIIPGDSLSGAAIDLARTTVRRSERRVSNLVHEGLIQNQDILRYLNRLSSLCFALELVEIQAAGISSPTFASEG
jgi:cob(I)alamin adenosyltransferase